MIAKAPYNKCLVLGFQRKMCVMDGDTLQTFKAVTYHRSKKITLPNTDYAHKNITHNFSQARSTLPEDGSQRIRNMSELLIVF